MGLNLGVPDFGNIAATGASYLLQGKLGKGLNNINSMINKIGKKISPSRIVGNRLGKVNQLDKYLSRGDPVMQYDWVAMIMPKKVSTDAVIPWHYIDKINVPEFTISPLSRKVNGNEVHYGGFPSVGQFNVSIYADHTGDSWFWLNNWIRSTYRQDKYFGLPSSYKRDIQIYIYDKKRLVVVDFLIKGCWPASSTNPDLSTQDGVITHDLTLYADEVFVNYESDLTAAKNAMQGVADSIVGSIKGAVLKKLLF